MLSQLFVEQRLLHHFCKLDVQVSGKQNRASAKEQRLFVAACMLQLVSKAFQAPNNVPGKAHPNGGAVLRVTGISSPCLAEQSFGSLQIHALSFILAPALLPRPVDVQIFLAACHEWRHGFSCYLIHRGSSAKTNRSKAWYYDSSQGRELPSHYCLHSNHKHLELLASVVHEMTSLTSSPGHTDGRGGISASSCPYTAEQHWMWVRVPESSPDRSRTSNGVIRRGSPDCNLCRNTCQKESQWPAAAHFLAWGNLLCPRLTVLITHSTPCSFTLQNIPQVTKLNHESQSMHSRSTRQITVRVN